MSRRIQFSLRALLVLVLAVSWFLGGIGSPAQEPNEYGLSALKVGRLDWPQWGGSSLRNNVPHGKNIPVDWSSPTPTQQGKNIKWSANLGSVTYSSPVVANGKVFIGTNNGAGHVKRFESTVDLGCLLCFDEESGRFLWQHSNLKLPSGRVHDYPHQGVVSVPFVDGDRLWYVSNRGEVVCLDTEGFRDRENDGPFRDEDVVDENEADVVWKFDMMAKFGTRQHNMCTCSPTCAGGILFVATSNGVDEGHNRLPAPQAPAFAAFDRNTGEVLWTDNSPGENVLHGQWSSPAYAVIGGHAQVLFGGGDGWLYSFDPYGDGSGQAKLLWKFDCNPKESKYSLSGPGARNEFISLPVVYDQKVYVATGRDPEHGSGAGRLWCIDATKKLDGSDVSPNLAYDANGGRIPHRRFQAVQPEKGETARPNPNSAAVWLYETFDLNADGVIGFEETMHRSCGNVAIKDDLLYIADFAGLVHCVDAKTGTPNWTHDLLGSAWGASPLIVDGKVYIGDENANITVFEHARKKNLLSQVNMENVIYSTPVVANNVLYIATKSALFAIAETDDPASPGPNLPSGAEIVRHQSKVVQLSFSFRALTDHDLKRIAECHDLKSLYIGDCHNMTFGGLEALASLSELRRLDLTSGSASFSDAALKHVAKLTELEGLNISGEQITDAGLFELRQLRNLKRLYLYNSSISDAGLSQLKEIGNLEILGLRSPHISVRGLMQLSEISTLKHLLVSVGDADVRQLQRAMPKCQITKVNGR